MTNIEYIVNYFAGVKGMTLKDASAIMDRELKKAAKRNGLTVAQFKNTINGAPLEKVQVIVKSFPIWD